MTKPITVDSIRTPAGTYGRAVAPWDDEEVYAVAAAWAEASSPVLSWDGERWTPTQYQVANFRHDERDALRQILSDLPHHVDDDDIDTAISESVRIDSTSALVVEVATADETLRLCGGLDEFVGAEDDDDACAAYRRAACDSLAAAGYDPIAPRGQRLLHSQWCGAHWGYTAGAIATMDDDATADDRAAIDAAHEAGVAAARAVAATQSADDE